jgi:glycosyltransferase involved in cell wall biosynthesis
LPILTVGIPTYNSAEYIQMTIESLRNQSFTDWICLVSDDNSHDETINLLTNLIKEDEKFTLYKQTNRLGPHKNWNFLLENTQTEFFKLLHADDILHQLALELTIDAFQANSDLVLVSTNRSVSANPKPYSNESKGNTKLEVKNLEKVKTKFLIQGNNFIKEPSFVTFRTNALKQAKGFTSNWNYLVDMDTYLRVLEKGSLGQIQKNLGQFRISTSSWSSTLNREQIKEERLFLREIANRRKIVFIGLILITIRSTLRRLYFSLSTFRKAAEK